MKTRKVDVVITDQRTGQEIFRKNQFEIPEFYSDRAATIIASKYATNEETSALQIVDRVVHQIVTWGLEQNYFQAGSEANAFAAHLTEIFLYQRASLNSPAWFNLGVKENAQVGSACFIVPVEDNMKDILAHVSRIGMIFKSGSGAGMNVSKLRAKGELLSNKGASSGPISFMRTWDACAGSIRSGGKCLAPQQRVYTLSGPVPVAELALLDKFYVLSYDPPSNRYKVKPACAWKQGEKKEVVRIVTDKGQFEVTSDHPIKLNGTGEYREAKDLFPGASIFQCSIDKPQNYLRVHLRDGKKGKELLHRMVALDILGAHPKSVIHHLNGDLINNNPENLEITTQSDHATKHGEEIASLGEHVFQKNRFSYSGLQNGMHKSRPFWADSKKVATLRQKHSKSLLRSGRAQRMQGLAITEKILNCAFKLINKGYVIDTFSDYCEARKQEGGLGRSKEKQLKILEDHFGTYDAFYKEVRSRNHKVLSITNLGKMDVYSIEVDCPTEDNKSPQSGHNYVIWPNDKITGSGIVVSNTRRSAMLVCMDADHPDIMEFIECKEKEEDKAKILIKAGISPEEAYQTVFFQNANHSIRVTDSFMRAVENDLPWELMNRGHVDPDGEYDVVAAEVQARDIFNRMAEIAWKTGDPGIQFHDRMNEDNPVPSLGEIVATNPCSELSAINNSACNLASLNLTKYYLEAEKQFNFSAFDKDIKILITAMDIIAGSAEYPTAEIREVVLKTRPLGLGFTNLGTLLMLMGLPYDSEEAREQAAEITRFMTHSAFIRSIELSQQLGPFPAFEENKENCIEIYRRLTKSDDTDLIERCGLRNSQVTLLAPCGTISYTLDCDTTGIEPLFALKSMKTLAGGGTMEIIPTCVAIECHELAKKHGLQIHRKQPLYSIDDLIHPIGEQGQSIVGQTLNYLPAEEKAIFKTANEIHWKDHILMMAACQKHLSGAISKTVNLPSNATVEDVREAYMFAWKKELKALAIYRDGSKGMQPLQAMVEKEELQEEQDTEPKWQPIRRKLLTTRRALTHKFNIGGIEGFIIPGMYEDSSLGEIFLKVQKQGSAINGLMDAFAVIVSLALQYGVPLEVIARKMTLTRFDPQGFTDNPDIRICTSIVDYIFRWLIQEFGDEEEPLPDEDTGLQSIIPPPAWEQKKLDMSGPPCIECGGMTTKNGTCWVCTSCGLTTGCS